MPHHATLPCLASDSRTLPSQFLSSHREQEGGNLGLAWVALSSPCPLPPNSLPSLVSWGRVGHKSRISPLCSFPPLPVPSRAEGGQRKQSASPAPFSGFPLLPAPGRWFTPSPRPGRTRSWCQVSVELPESRDWALTGPFISLPFTLHQPLHKAIYPNCPSPC